MVYVTYAIRSANGRIYIGQTQNFTNRLKLHNKGTVASTRRDRPWQLLKLEEFQSRAEARFFEWQLKRSKGKRDKWLAAGLKK